MITTIVNFDKQLLTPTAWKNTLLLEKYSPITLAIKDPTGMSSYLIAYQRVANSGPSWLFDRMRALKGIEDHANKLLDDYKSDLKKSKLCIYLKALYKAAEEAYRVSLNQGLLDITEGRDHKNLIQYRLAVRSEVSEADLDFVMEVKAFQKKIANGGMQFNDVVDEQDRIMDKYGVRTKKQLVSANENSEATEVNLPGKVKDDWVNVTCTRFSSG